MTAQAIGSAIVGALTTGFALIAQVANAIKDGFVALFFEGEGSTQSVSTFAVVMLVFGGVTLAFGLSRVVMNLITSKIG